MQPMAKHSPWYELVAMNIPLNVAMITFTRSTWLLLFSALTMQAIQAQDITYPGLRLVGRHLYTPCEDNVVLRGVNKMSVWASDLALRKKSYSEIRKTGANCVRIVWLAQPGPNEIDAGVDGLDRTIQDCIDNDMIPMIELHDATGQWAKLQMVLDYWKRPDVLAVIKKHEKYLIVNIANECGDIEVTDDMFKAGYESALTQLREAGIHTPLVIDAADWGKNMAQLVRVGPYLMNKDPDMNVMFSVHTYWSVADGADAAYIAAQFQAAVNAGMPFIIGEFAGLFNKGGACLFQADYESIIRLAQEMGIGYLAWEWGPGNEYAHPTCTVMNMTTDSHYATLQSGWAKDLAVTNLNGIQKTSLTPQYIINAGRCMLSSTEEGIAQVTQVIVVPNPFTDAVRISVYTQHDGRLRVSVITALGEEIATLVDKDASSGRTDVSFAVPSGEASGLLYCCVVSNGKRTVHPLLHVR